MRKLLCGLVAAGLMAAAGTSAPVPKAAPKPTHGEKNTNALVTQHKEKMEAKATSDWAPQWPVEHLFDGKDETSWYSKAPDSTLTDQKPAVTVTFPDDVRVKRVTILGNRDPQYPTGYFVSEGTVELLDDKGKVISSHEMKSAGDKHDFDLKLDRFVTLRGVRFTCTKSENGNCGLSELQVE
ncbi:MAG: discoidin domain-containing protein [Fimbriiglobus sp.]|nr:discoidin domain-containing protein [Fimbriiglobus sp.]